MFGIKINFSDLEFIMFSFFYKHESEIYIPCFILIKKLQHTYFFFMYIYIYIVCCILNLNLNFEIFDMGGFCGGEERHMLIGAGFQICSMEHIT